MILDESFPPDPRVANESNSLINEGHKVFLFCLAFDKKLLKEELINGINVNRYRIPKLIYKFSALAYSLPVYHIWMFLPLYRFLKKSNVDVIHVHDIRIYRSIHWISKLVRVPIVLDLHENRPEIMKHYKHVKEAPGKFLISTNRWKRFEYDAISRVKKVIVVTNHAKEYYLREVGDINPDKFIILPNSVTPSFYKNPTVDDEILNRLSDSFNLIYIGDTSIRRGLLVVLDALAIVKNQYPNIKLIILGKSSADELLKKRINYLGLENQVYMEGWVDSSLFPSYIKASKIGLSPILRNLHHDTTYANKLFQYLSLGLPVIVSDCDSQKELVDRFKCGVSYAAENEQELALNIIDLYEKDQLLYEMSQNAIECIVDELNWNVSAKSLVQLYEEL
jgi:glycosyltransferase involved in cell wall biosynthesis